MRRHLSTLVFTALAVSCGAFGGSSSDSPPSDQGPPGTPDQNAQPPGVNGAPLTGIFASSSKGGAAPDADGSMTKPFKSLADAIAVALSTHQRVIACAEEFDEAVVVPDGVSMYGYYDCAQSPWARVNSRAVVKSPTSPALSVTEAPHKMRVDGFEITAPDLDAAPAADPSKASSIAAFVVHAQDLTLGDVILRAGNGAPGVDGVEGEYNLEQAVPTGVDAVTQKDLNCTPPQGGCGLFEKAIAGSAGGTSKCLIGTLNGGVGGNGGQGVYYPSTDGPCNSPVGYTGQGQGATATTATAQGGVVKTKGNDGAAGTDGTDGLNGAFTMDASGFHPGNGTQGVDGQPGQGGGGGGGNFQWGANTDYCPSSAQFSSGWQTAVGAGGGAGGCPGFAGKPGTGGGASIGAFLYDSTVTWEQGEVHSSTGGRAGKGTIGSNGLAGGEGGKPTGSDNGGSGAGGKGGVGGSGGLSGHGAPGPSIGIAYHGSAPNVPGTTQVVPGQAGAGQDALQKTTTAGAAKSLPAVTGVSQAQLEIN